MAKWSNDVRKWLLWCCVCIHVVMPVDRSNFKTCDQSGFCKRHRALQPGLNKFRVLMDTWTPIPSGFSCNLIDTGSNKKFNLYLTGLTDKTVRMRIFEVDVLTPRYEVPPGDVVQLEQEMARVRDDRTATGAVLTFDQTKVVLSADPFRLDFVQNGSPVIAANSRGLLKFEHQRKNPSAHQEAPPPADTGEEAEKKEEEHGEGEEAEKKEEPAQEEPGLWDEDFKGHKDTKPRGPESLGMDIAFPGFEFVYGIPQHADSLALRTTTGTDPYRLYNLDVFEYELNNPMALYGSVPVMLAHSEKTTVGVFWNNPSETWIDIKNSAADKNVLSKLVDFVSGSDDIPQVDTHWFSESGVMDVYFMLGPTAADVFRQYGKLTGTTPLPPMFSIAYHQCRWNYNDEDDVKSVDAGYDKHDIPVDAIWLDIEHTDGKRYFTWDRSRFPTSADMINRLAAKGRKMVNTIDPHLKRVDDYKVYNQVKDIDGYTVKNKDGGVFEGWCWPGSSVWLDFLNPKVRHYWAEQFNPVNFEGTTNDLYTWNDMNEPSVFNGPEITMHKDCKHFGNWEHRDVHNIYGLYVHRSSFEGHLLRTDNSSRPFVLSRAYYAGSQKYGAIWTGDNTGDWGHLKMSVPMLLSSSLVGITFIGADVGGFFKNPDAELLTRWYQAGAYQPFFRAHAHLDTRRREPWLMPPEHLAAIRQAVITRYQLLPYWYLLFYLGERHGGPVMKPLWVDFPADRKTFGLDDQHLVGSALLVKPVTEPGASSVEVYLPGADQLWYDTDTLHSLAGGAAYHVPVTLTKIPVFQRGGFIVPRKQRIRRSSILTLHDPYTLIVTLDKQGHARGEVYMDDQQSYEYRYGKFIHRKLEFNGKELTSRELQKGQYATRTWLERVVIAGVAKQPSSVTVTGQSSTGQQIKGEKRGFTYDPTGKILVVRKPAVSMGHDFTLTVQ